MTKLDCQILEAMYHGEGWYSKSFNDESIFESGNQCFGKGWITPLRGPTSSGAYYYHPLISLRLGKLARRGLVIKHNSPAYTFSVWKLSERGKDLVKGIISE